MAMLLSHCGEYPCECKNFIFAVNSPEMIRLARRITETSEALGYTWLRMFAIFLRILANFLPSLRLLNNQFAEFLVNPWRMLRIFTNALANVANALRLKRLHNACAAKPLANVSLCHFYSPGYIK